MTSLTEFLFPAPAPRGPGAIVKWWEARRLPYNLVMGGTGVFSLTVVNLLGALPPDANGLFVPWIGVAVFGLLANFCYLLGPTVEVALEKLWGRELLPTGPALFRMGLTFSVGLTLLPVPIALLDWAVRIVRALL